MNSKKSPVWEYFENEGKHSERKYKICKRVFSQKTSVDSLSRHLMSFHQINLEKSKPKQEKIEINKEKSSKIKNF